MAQCSIVVLKVPLNINQTNKHSRTYFQLENGKPYDVQTLMERATGRAIWSHGYSVGADMWKSFMTQFFVKNESIHIKPKPRCLHSMLHIASNTIQQQKRTIFQRIVKWQCSKRLAVFETVKPCITLVHCWLPVGDVYMHACRNLFYMY